MSGKYMKVKHILIPAMTLAIIASTLTGCASATQQELGELLSKQSAIEITIPTMEGDEDITVEEAYKWVELAYLDNYQDFREEFDDTFGITAFGNNGKNGVVYVDTQGNQTNNSTLHFAFYNKKFINSYWNNTEVMRHITEEIRANYIDIETDEEAIAAVLNAYFNLFADTTDGQFHGSDTITRAEYLAFVYRAENPVSDIKASDDFVNLVDPSGNNENNKFAEQMVNYSYLGTKDYSLNNATYKGLITKGEAAYTLATMYYADEYAKTEASKDSFDIVKSATSKKNETDYSSMNYVSNSELSYAIKNDVGAPARIDRAIQVLNNHGITDITTDNWSEPITKQESIIAVTEVYEDLGTKTNADRGNATGENLNTNEDDESNVLLGSNSGAEATTYGVFMRTHLVDTNGTYSMDEESAEIIMDLLVAKGATESEINWWLNQEGDYGLWADAVYGTADEQTESLAQQRMWLLEDLGDVDYRIHDEYAKAHQSSGSSSSSTQKPSNGSSNSSNNSSNDNGGSSSSNGGNSSSTPTEDDNDVVVIDDWGDNTGTNNIHTETTDGGRTECGECITWR